MCVLFSPSNSMDASTAAQQLFQFQADAPDFSTLPMPALVCIMRYLPLRCRIGSCGMVCTVWADAAAAATNSFDWETCTDHNSLALYLGKYGHLVTTMELRSSPDLKHLPCPQLQQLSILQSSLHMAPGSQLALDIAAATQLSSVRLNQVVFKGGTPDLDGVLGALPNLQELALQKLQGHEIGLYPYLTRLLEQQPDRHTLTRLELELSPRALEMLPRQTWWSVKVQDNAEGRLQTFHALLQAVGSVTSLQHLELDVPSGISGEACEHLALQPSLTSLHLGGLNCSFTAWPLVGTTNSFKTSPGDGPAPKHVRPMPALRHLSLAWQSAGHTAWLRNLAGWSQLQSLKLRSVALPNNAAGDVELLGALHHLLQLTALVLDDVQFARGADLACFAALLSHSPLRHLGVINTKLPWTELTAPFEPTATLPTDTEAQPGVTTPRCLLRSLHLNLDTPSLAVSAGAVEALVRRCTGIQALHIQGVGPQSPEGFSGDDGGGFGAPSFLSALQTLQHLTSLAASGVDDLSVYTLAQLTGLCKLRILAPSTIHDVGLQALTCLQRLTALELCPCQFSAALFRAVMQAATARNQPGQQSLWRISSTGSLTMPDVWQQLQAITSSPPPRTAPAAKGPSAASTARRRGRRPAQLSHAAVGAPRLELGSRLLEAPGARYPLTFLVADAGIYSRLPTHHSTGPVPHTPPQ